MTRSMNRLVTLALVLALATIANAACGEADIEDRGTNGSAVELATSMIDVAATPTSDASPAIAEPTPSPITSPEASPTTTPHASPTTDNTASVTLEPTSAWQDTKTYTFEEADALLPFDLVPPDPLPASLRLVDVFVDQNVNDAILRFTLTDGIDPYVGVRVEQRAFPHSINTNHHLRRVATIDGREITRITDDSSWCFTYRGYEWEQDGVYLTVESHLTGDATDDVLLDLLAATLGVDPQIVHASDLATETDEEQQFGRPGSEQGRVCRVSVDEARQVVDFPIVLPEALPEGLVFNHLYLQRTQPDEGSGSGAVQEDKATGDTWKVVTLFRDTGASNYWDFVVLEQSATDQMHSEGYLDKMPVKLIAGVEVSTVFSSIISPPGLPEYESRDYYWQSNGIYFRLEAATEVGKREIYDVALEQLVSATLIGSVNSGT